MVSLFWHVEPRTDSSVVETSVISLSLKVFLRKDARKHNHKRQAYNYTYRQNAVAISPCTLSTISQFFS